jgi:hypothetical protein
MMWLFLMVPIEIAFLVMANARKVAIQKAVDKALDLGLDDPNL